MMSLQMNNIVFFLIVRTVNIKRNIPQALNFLETIISAKLAKNN